MSAINKENDEGEIQPLKSTSDELIESLSSAPIDRLLQFYWGLLIVSVPLICIWMANKPTPSIFIPVVENDISIYRLITVTDVITVPVAPSTLAPTTILEVQELVNHYSLNPLDANTPITKDEVTEIRNTNLISDTIAVAIMGTEYILLGSKLKAGDIVMLTSVPTSDEETIFLLDEVLVLDVIDNESDKVVILAIPSNRWNEYIVYASKGVMISLPIK